ncbi:mediator of RNA polymerase II transcription subunit 16, partial [Ostrinia furnacalis]|uniref:mediator of RNA polymerase II transcription subunit 16 n=1 Tax=Ostrinia furnacalis TaxID=93504 RepID=UPI00103B7A30
MELIYSMRRKPLKCEPPHFESPTSPEVVRPICTISSCNIIAFSSPTELSDVDGDTWGGHVYVCDLDTPWDSHKVTSTAHPISALEWDNEGKHLLVGTTSGEVSVFGQKDYLLNEWTCLYSASFPGEHIVKAAFFHNGRRVVACEKKPDAPIADRFQVLRSTPTLKGFGGVACEGAAIITATGLVCALTPPADGSRALVAAESLRAAREHIAAASVAHKNGNLLIAAVCRSAGAWCVRVSVCCAAPPARPAPAPAPPRLQLQPLPALCLPESSTPPVSITWCLREDTDSLLVAGSNLTLWKLTERSHPVHKLFSKGALQGSTTPGGGPKPSTDCFNTVVWQQTAIWPIEGGSTAVQAASSRLALAPPHAVLATPDALHLLHRDTHHYICSRNVISRTGAVEVPAGAGTPPKKPKYGPGAVPSGSPCAQLSWVEISQLGGVCVCIDTHACLHVLRLPLWPDIQRFPVRPGLHVLRLPLWPDIPVRAQLSWVEITQLGGVCVCIDTHACLHVLRLPLWPDIQRFPVRPGLHVLRLPLWPDI